MIIVNNLTKSILDKTLFTDVSFVVHEKEKVGLIGVNGSGKSTLFKIILGEEFADSGTVDVQGERLGYLPQAQSYPAQTSVQEILSLDKTPAGKKYLQQVGLSNLNTTLAFESLSGGQKTCVALAKVLMDRPTALLLDEPTNHLDFEAIEWFEQWLKSFHGSVLLIKEFLVCLQRGYQSKRTWKDKSDILVR